MLSKRVARVGQRWAQGVKSVSRSSSTFQLLEDMKVDKTTPQFTVGRTNGFLPRQVRVCVYWIEGSRVIDNITLYLVLFVDMRCVWCLYESSSDISATETFE
jgi:hypothetical protein